jgi:hypothetical protein
MMAMAATATNATVLYRSNMLVVRNDQQMLRHG